MTQRDKAPIDADRLWNLLQEVNRFGALDDGGVDRRAWTDPEVEARAWLVRRCRDEGLDADYDEAGNVWAWSGRRPAIVLGSHLDSVPSGGRFDGSLGVIGALEALVAARAAGAPGSDRLGLACFNDEEGVRFNTGFTGSRAVAGQLTPDELRAATAEDGTRLGDELARRGFDPAQVGSAAARRADIAGYIELHIEQGPRLDRAGDAIGVVDAIVGLRSLEIEVSGEFNHAGTTPPEDRRDALVPVAAAILEAQRVMHEGTSNVLATVGLARVVGGATNIVPGLARATLDVRSTEASAMLAAIERILASLGRAAHDNSCRVRAEVTRELAPVEMDGAIVAVLRDSARARGLDAPILPSMAGHDAMTLAAAGVPSGMVFVRSRGGISHSPKEASSKEDCALGAQVLVDAALSLAAAL